MGVLEDLESVKEWILANRGIRIITPEEEVRIFDSNAVHIAHQLKRRGYTTTEIVKGCREARQLIAEGKAWRTRYTSKT